ncbi:MAG: Pyridoxal-dependent decarboxylase [Nocardioides sp.]|nr:Pyridoxal-dependent decarboxylase [Nocardioides sp.]
MTDALARLRELQAGDLAIHGGRSLAYVYDSGRADVDAVAAEAVSMYAGANGLDPSAFPSMLAMENELVGFACDLVDAPDTAAGTVTTGGTESIMLAVQAARDARPDIERPNIVLPETAHPSFQKAAQYFGIDQVSVRVDGHYRAQVGAMAEAMDADTVLAVASAPSYAHGVIDPIAWIAAACAAKDVPLHVDACIGGWILAYADRIGRVKPAWTFAVPGVSSISVDLHKYGYTPKGASILLHRTAAGRRPTYFSSADWPGYTMVNTTMASTRPGGPLAGAWATVQAIGEGGYVELARDCLDAVDLLLAGIDRIDGLELVVRPDSTLVAVRTDGSCDVFTIADEMVERGWYVGPQMSWRGEPPTLHLSVSAATLGHVDECLAALRDSVAAARATGPVRVDRSIVAVLDTLSPDRLTDDEFDALLVAAGLAGGAGVLTLPKRMAPVNVLFNVASPRLREALLETYVDRLYRPVRARLSGAVTT